MTCHSDNLLYMNTLAIDPGNVLSAFIVWNGQEILDKGKVLNHELLEYLAARSKNYDVCVIEQIAAMGMAVGASVFETVFWSGRFFQVAEQAGKKVLRIPRKDVKMNLCNSMRAKDKNIRQAIIDRLDPNNEPNKKPQGVLKGVHADEWAALGIALTYNDLQLKQY